MDALKSFIDKCQEAIQAGNFIKVNLGNYKGNKTDLKQCFVKPILIKHKLKLSFTYRRKTNDLFKNYDLDEGLVKLETYIKEGFYSASLFTTHEQLNLSLHPKGKYILRKENSVINQTTKLPLLQHDRIKQKDIAENATYLQALGLANEKGEVYKNAQDKYKQINHYIKLLKPAIQEIGSKNINEVADMGSGKGYLTFALYDYLHKLNPDVKVQGIEFRSDLVNFCKQVSREQKFDGLSFTEGSIINTKLASNDLIIALHACDTATDEAIYKGLKAKSKLIVVAPCCHKQIRREMEKQGQVDELQLITKQGIFLERQAEMLTDAIRILILEYNGYKTKALEFISDSHTPKNVMLIAVRKKEPAEKAKNAILKKLHDAKQFYGFSYHHLERLLGLTF